MCQNRYRLGGDDPENENLNATQTSEPLHGKLDNWDAVKGTVTYNPGTDYQGPDGFTFKVKDIHGLESENEGTVSITVSPPISSNIAGGMLALPELS